MFARQRQTIRKGCFLLLIPGGSQNRDLSVSLELAGEDCDQRKQSQQYRCGARDCQIAPLTLRLDASDNVAKPLIEFAVNIPRERLRPAPADRRRHR
jgi:hypothetical protein